MAWMHTNMKYKVVQIEILQFLFESQSLGCTYMHNCVYKYYVNECTHFITPNLTVFS